MIWKTIEGNKYISKIFGSRRTDVVMVETMLKIGNLSVSAHTKRLTCLSQGCSKPNNYKIEKQNFFREKGLQKEKK